MRAPSVVRSNANVTRSRIPLKAPKDSSIPSKDRVLSPEESIAWEATTSYELVIDWKGLANGGRKIDRVGFKLNTKLPKVAQDQFVLMINLRDAALRCVWPLSRSQARWGGRRIIAMAHGLAPHMSWMEPGGSALLGILSESRNDIHSILPSALLPLNLTL